MDHHHNARVLAVLRIAIGAAALVAPGVATTALSGRSHRSPTTSLMVRLFGARDLVLGAGALHALTEGRDATNWVRLGALCDATDAVSISLGLARLPRRLPAALGMASAAVAAVTGYQASRAVEAAATSAPAGADRLPRSPLRGAG